MSLVYIAAAVITAIVCVLCFKVIPEKWLCDYNEAPSDIHSFDKRVIKPFGIAAAALFNACSAALFLRISESAVVNISFCLFSGVMILISLCDTKYSIIPNELLALALVFGLPLAFRNGWKQPLYGFLIGGIGLFCIVFIAGKLLKAEAMGMGDILLSALCGIMSGGVGYAAVFFTAVITAGIYFTVMIILKRVDKKSSQPFGPFLVLGAFLAICLQPEWQTLLAWYLGAY